MAAAPCLLPPGRMLAVSSLRAGCSVAVALPGHAGCLDAVVAGGALARGPLPPGRGDRLGLWTVYAAAGTAAGVAGAFAEYRRPRRAPGTPIIDVEEDQEAGGGTGGRRPLSRSRGGGQRRVPFARVSENAVGRPLSHSAELLMRAFRVEQWRATRMAEVLQRWTVRREGEDPTGTKTKRWTRRLVRGLEQHPLLRKTLFNGNLGECVVATLEELERRSTRHGRKVDAIERQHRANREGAEADSAEYSEASAYMGEEWWMRAAHARVAKWIDEYFLLTPEQVRRGHHPWAFKTGGLPSGWKRYVVAGRSMFWNPIAKRMQLQEPPVEPGDAAAAPPPREPPIALLDIGSCSNPFDRFTYLIEPVALDLHPGEGVEGVLQADFFEVPILEPEEGEHDGEAPEQRILLGEGGQLEGILAGSFDVVVLSLVLSFVPDPRRRMEMVARARRCLRNDRGLLFVIEVGSALADASWYEGDAATDWSRAIEEAGFRTKLFEDEVKESYPPKSHRLLQWVFETAPLQDKALKPLMTPREMPW